MSTPFEGRLRERLAGGETLLGTFLNLGSPVAAEICGAAGFDWVVVDLEHGSGSEAVLLSQLQAVATTSASGLVRVESHERSRIGRALDAGAAGVMVPRVDTAEQAAAVVAASRYPPAGARGVALMNRAAGFGARSARLAEADDLVLVAVQVESPRAIEGAREIAGVDGVDVLFVGPADLSHALGCFGRFDAPVFVAAVRAVAEACRATGKAAGALASSPDDAERYLAEGYRFLGVSGDGGFLARGASAAADELRRRAGRRG